MQKLSFSTGAIIRQSWSIFRQKWAQLFGIMILSMLVSSVGGTFVGALQDTDLAGLVPIMSIALQVFSLFVSIGMMKLLLALVRDQQVNYSELFAGGKYLIQFLLGSLVVGFLIVFGYLLLIIPGVIWSIKYMFTMFLIVDEGMEFSAAMKESAHMTEGIKWQLLGFSFAMVGLNLLGMLALFVGLIITIPLTTLAGYVVYDHLRKQTKPSPHPEHMDKLESAPMVS